MQDMREEMDDVQEMMAEAMVGDIDCDEDDEQLKVTNKRIKVMR